MNPSLGQPKLGDLQGVFVYKFRFNAQEYLMAYQFNRLEGTTQITWIKFHQIGSHENFYRHLKKSIRLK